MKRKFLEDLKLEKETIDKIMDEHGKDVTKLTTERDNFKNQYETAQTALKGFEGVDVNELQTKISTLNTQLANKDTEWQGKLDELEFSGLLKDAVKGAGARNDKAVIALLDVANLKKSKNRQADIITALEAVKKDNGFLFEDDDPQNVNLGGNHNNKPETKELTWESALEEHYGKE
ncbi:phage scaffolding protein [[Clostridium] innocuum]|jgi:predicted  nucleic acid-binding Zn-ribbon protein|uniref:phage scaffolding protein n=1 Tax=Clostridium innocuum TaxID=1522 RepID=UPI001EDCE3E2|nr:phage scaffolding protein [[Clostridium] innocuum]MCG4661070.1 phage scaffolding protein [[Clostridium] innocuum]MCI3002664.1 phage scaffolding protein [[Clostridium] innocuum]MCR0212006.1 phage scaffolding protein [[Clostridium] innocuum]